MDFISQQRLDLDYFADFLEFLSEEFTLEDCNELFPDQTNLHIPALHGKYYNHVWEGICGCVTSKGVKSLSTYFKNRQTCMRIIYTLFDAKYFSNPDRNSHCMLVNMEYCNNFMWCLYNCYAFYNLSDIVGTVSATKFEDLKRNVPIWWKTLHEKQKDLLIENILAHQRLCG